MSPAPFTEASHCLFLKAGQFDPDEANNLDAIFQSYSNAPQHLVLHFHGGLVDKAAGRQIATSMYQNCYGDAAYPVFFLWESGALFALRRTLPKVLAEAIFNQLLELVTGWALGKVNQVGRWLVGGSRGERPPLGPESKFYVKGELKKVEAGKDAFQGKNPHTLPENETLRPDEENLVLRELLKNNDLREEAAKIAKGLRTPEQMAADAASPSRGDVVQSSTATLMSQEVIDEMRPPLGTDEGVRGPFSAMAALTRIATGAVTVLAKVVQRFASQRDHGIHATVVEEILREFYLGNLGREVWTTMKKDTARAFGADAGAYGGTAFLNKLKALWDANAPPARMVLVGHSAGAIYACHFMQYADAVLPPGVQFDVVFLAPACDFKLLAETLKKVGKRIRCFRLYAMKDELEKAELLLDIDALNLLPALKRIYPGSLLYFVSGLFEEAADWPIVGMGRFHSDQKPFEPGRFAEIDDVRYYLDAMPNSRVWSKTSAAGLGLRSESIKHGDFDNDKTTLESLAHVLRNGF